MCIRDRVAAVIMAMLCKKEKVPLMGAQPKLLFFRSLFGFLSTILVFAAATDAYPIANLSLLSSTSTIFALIAAVVWLKERMSRGQVLAIFIAFGGIEMCIRDRLNIENNCPFADRCEHAMKVCKMAMPQAEKFSETHFCSCWLNHPYAQGKGV